MRRTRAGFTLVEVVVALAIMALVMLATVTAFRTLGNTANTLNAMTDRVDELRSVSSFLRDAFENAVVGAESGGSDGLSFGGGGGDAKPAAYFKVRNGGVEWRSSMRFGESAGGTQFLRLTQSADKLVLLWQAPEDRLEPKLESWNQASSRTVLDKLEVFEIATKAELGEPWQVGADLRAPPALVRLVIKASGRFWPELIMPVQR